MRFWYKSLSEITALGLMGMVIILGVIVFTPDRDASSSPQLAAQPSLTAVSTVTTEPPSNPTVTVPADAEYDAAEEAVAFAAQVARESLKAENAHLVRVELLTLEDALIKAQQVAKADPDRAMDGQDQSQAKAPVWRVVFDGDEFHIPMCPLRRQRNNLGLPEPAPNQSCGSGPYAVLTFYALDGEFVSLAIPNEAPL